MIVVFYTKNCIHLCMTCSTSYCLCEKLTDPHNCVCVCVGNEIGCDWKQELKLWAL